MGQAAGEVVLLEAVESHVRRTLIQISPEGAYCLAVRQASNRARAVQHVGTGSRSRNGAYGDAEPQRLLADEPE